jgi:16S rRNA (uracil1498-N3)-methyltransferase
MRRYFFDGNLECGRREHIQGDLFHHIFDVCRLQVGQHFEFISAQGEAYLAEVESVSKRQAEVLIREKRTLPPLREPHIHLFLSFPKIPTFELIVEKSVELGVSAITPVLSDFSFVRSMSQFPTVKVPRWKKIILQATQQSGRGDLMPIHEPRKLEEVLATRSTGSDQLTVVAYEGESPTSLKEYLSLQKRPSIKCINVFVGSEGGFSDKEITQFKKLDLSPVTLGDQVLRVETACLTLVASLKYEFELLS